MYVASFKTIFRSEKLTFRCSPVVMHSDHCAEKLLPWFDGMLEADEAYFKEHGESLFSSHMLDLSEDPKDKNIAICAKYFKRMAPIGLWLEMEIGITGGEEDGVDNTGADNSSLYTQPEDVYDVYKALSAIGPNFSIAAAFGNVHGVYKPGNVKLLPNLLGKHQEYVSQQIQKNEQQPLYAFVLYFSIYFHLSQLCLSRYLVFHGGSGSTKDEIATAVSYGVVKMNVDTDTQFAYLIGIRVSGLVRLGSHQTYRLNCSVRRTSSRKRRITFRLRSETLMVQTNPTRR